jgi:hypothetical protein
MLSTDDTLISVMDYFARRGFVVLRSEELRRKWRERLNGRKKCGGGGHIHVSFVIFNKTVTLFEFNTEARHSEIWALRSTLAFLAKARITRHSICIVNVRFSSANLLNSTPCRWCAHTLKRYRHLIREVCFTDSTGHFQEMPIEMFMETDFVHVTPGRRHFYPCGLEKHRS